MEPFGLSKHGQFMVNSPNSNRNHGQHPARTKALQSVLELLRDKDERQADRTLTSAGLKHQGHQGPCRCF